MCKSFLGIKLFLSSIMAISMLEPIHAQVQKDQFEISWRTSENYNGKDNLDLVLVLKNTKNKAVQLDRGDIWFNTIFPLHEKKDSNFELSDKNGNLFCIRFADGTQLKAKDSIVMTYASKYPIVNVSTVPNGFYYQDRVDHSKHYNIPLQAAKIKGTAADQNLFWEKLYDKIQARGQASDSKLILPTPKSVQQKKGQLTIQGAVSYRVDEAFYSEIANLNEFALQFSGLSFTEGGEDALLKIVKKAGYGKEAYGLEIDGQGIRIEASTGTGIFYALQTVRSLLTVSDFKAASIQLPFVSIQDEPRYAYRGLMLDIARNFRGKESMLKYLDLMSHYKLNTFHFHFIDDEGWRIAMPSFPELTEVGANRSAMFHNGSTIQPAYGSGAEPTKGHYLTRQDFIEILRYAKQRHIKVVPEIETPGHARASIKAMEARYHRYMKEGNKAEAEKYLLHDFDDKSVYSSAQYFNDNIMNPALPSVYAFLGVVLDDFKQMYSDAGLTLEKVSLGGDEVPNGVWEKSPKIMELMRKENFKTVYEVWPYYIQKVNELCHARGVQMAGWEEMGMVNQGKGMDVNPALKNGNIQLDVWNNLVGGGQEDLAYRLANAGYETVYISANNNYFDMAWSTNFDEPGLKWASYADLYQSYTFLPEHFFSTIEYSINGAKFPKGHFKNSVRLTEEGRKNLVGIKGGLWAETVQTVDRTDYMLFPRLFALAERAWSPRKDYEDDVTFSLAAFDKDYSQFINKVGNQELKKIASTVKFRLPAVGLKEIEGKLYANVEYPGFGIYYTTDGSVPTATSTRYDAPIALKKGQVATFVTVGDDGRTSLPSVFTK